MRHGWAGYKNGCHCAVCRETNNASRRASYWRDPEKYRAKARAKSRARRRRLKAEREQIDEIAVERACRGDKSVALNRTEMAAAMAYLHRHRKSLNEIADRLGVTQRTVARWRAGETQLPYGRPAQTALKPSPAEPEQPGELAS